MSDDADKIIQQLAARVEAMAGRLATSIEHADRITGELADATSRIIESAADSSIATAAVRRGLSGSGPRIASFRRRVLLHAATLARLERLISENPQ